MADQHNDNIPALANQISADIPDIKENLEFHKDVFQQLFTTWSNTDATAMDTLTIDTISEKTAATGVTIDSVVLKDGGITLSGTLACVDNALTRPEITDYSETVNTMGDLGGGTDDIDLESGNVVTATVSTSEQTFTFSNPSASGKGCGFILILTNGGSQTVNWPAEVDWVGGTAPTLTSSGIDYLGFVTVDAGTIWAGFEIGIDVQSP